MTLRALAANDERIVEYFRKIYENKRTSKLIDVEIDVKSAKNINIQDFINAIELKIWNRLAKLSRRQYDEAREFAKNLNLRNQKEWYKYVKGKIKDRPQKPEDIPSYPEQAYKYTGWLGWKDYLGSEYLSYDDAREFVKKLNLSGVADWEKYIKGNLPEKPRLPQNIPPYPNQAYKNNGWINWKDWLGNVYRDYEEAKKFVRSLGLKSSAEWGKYIKGELLNKIRKPQDIPASPGIVYKGRGWIGINDFLGNNFLSFNEARKFVKKLELNTWQDWNDYVKGQFEDKPPKPDNIPSFPYKAYKHSGWMSIEHWLGREGYSNEKRKFRDFIEAKKFVKALRLQNVNEWKKYTQGKYIDKPSLPDDLPINPYEYYKNNGWKDFNDWLGLEYRTYEEAQKFISELHLKDRSEWEKYFKNEYKNLPIKPNDIPKNPQNIYRYNGWKSWGEWLGHRKSKYLDYERAKDFVRTLGLKSKEEWNKYVNDELKDKPAKPSNIPSAPSNVYGNKGEWVSIEDFLGIEYLSIEEAKKFVWDLKIKSLKEWKQYVKWELKNHIQKPNNIPSDPLKQYKGKGWVDIRDWLGITNEYTYVDYGEARKFTRELGLKNQSEWRRYAKGEFKDKPLKPKNIPAGPYQYYHLFHGDKGWISWGDWLGTDSIDKKTYEYRNFEKAREFVRTLHLKSDTEWRKFPRELLPNDIPKSPWSTYKNKGWKGIKDWLGTK